MSDEQETVRCQACGPTECIHRSPVIVTTQAEMVAAIEAAVARERVNVDYLKQAANSFNRDLIAAQTEVERLQADLAVQREQAEEGHRLLGTFFEALKPLNLQMINVQDPGSHVTNLITERDVVEGEVGRLRDELAAAQRNLDKCIEDNAAWLLRDVERSKVARTDLVAAERRGREAEREQCAQLAENIYPDSDWPLAANFAVRDRIARAIRARGDEMESTLPGGVEV